MTIISGTRTGKGMTTLVKLNLKNPEVVSELLSVVDLLDRHVWRRRSSSRCRLLPGSGFPAYASSSCQKPQSGVFPAWRNAPWRLQHLGKQRDARFVYELRMLQKDCIPRSTRKTFTRFSIPSNAQFGKEPWCLYTGRHLLSFVDNHDVNRIASQLENKKQLPAIYAMLFTMPGIPAVYYGSEWGMEGRKNQKRYGTAQGS